MTDKDIIKALKCCGNVANCCDECPIISKLKDDCKCCQYLSANALDLINRQQAEIEELKIINEHLATFNIENEAEIKRLKAEEEKYPFKCVMPFNSMVCSKSIEDYDRLVGDIGADAIKEFAERLKSYLLLYKPNQMSVISLENIDNLVKEMVGEE